MKIKAGKSEQMIFEPIKRKDDLCGHVTKKISYMVIWFD